MNEPGRAAIDHALLEAMLTRRRLQCDHFAMIEAVANYHAGMAQHGAQLRKIVEMTQYYPECRTEESKKAMDQTMQQITNHYFHTFGEMPAWGAKR